MTPEISIIIPTYAPGELLWTCLDSLEQQTLGKNAYEVCLVLNGDKEPYFDKIKEHLKNYKKEDTVLITTGSQGESLAALSRMAADLHKKVSIMPGDVVILSSTPIPGNEKAVARVINELSMKGAEVINQDTHVSGHACQEEIKLVYSLVRPKFAIPIHGEYRHRMAQKELAISLGIPKENVVMLHTGDVLEIGESGADVIDHVQSGGVLVDGLGVGDVGNIVLRDRQNLAQNGIIIVVLTL